MQFPGTIPTATYGYNAQYPQQVLYQHPPPYNTTQQPQSNLHPTNSTTPWPGFKPNENT